MKILCPVIFFLIFCQILIFPRDRNTLDTVGVCGIDWFAYPFAFYSPETSLTFGVGGIVYFKLLLEQVAKASSITPLFYYSVNG